MSRVWLHLLLLPFTLALALAQSTNDPNRLFERVSPGLLRVEIDLQYSAGEAPTGIIDQDPGAGGPRYFSLAQVVEQERPLETTGYLIGPRDVVALDANIHPRFIKAIRVLGPKGSTRATMVAQAGNHWAMRLQLAEPLEGTAPIVFGTGRPAFTVTYYRLEGTMILEAAGYSSRFQRADGGPLIRHHDHGGVAVTTDGTPVGVLITRRLDDQGSWLGSPDRWTWIGTEDLARRNAELSSLTRASMPRVRLSFRSPKLTASQQRARFRDRDDDHEGDATERDVMGVVMGENKILVLAQLKSTATARLQKITVHPEKGNPITARFVASLKDFGAFVAELDSPMPVGVTPAGKVGFNEVGQLLLRADIQLQGEQRSDYFHTARIASQRTGPRMEAYPELVDMSDVNRIHLFNLDRQLVALPVGRREPINRRGDDSARGPAMPVLTPARLLFDAVRGLPATADSGNTPLPESDENRLAWLGVELQPLGRELARANNVADQTHDGETGAMVTFVHPDSPAAAAKLAPGAIILRIQATDRPVPVDVHLDEDEMRSSPFPWERLDEISERFFDRLPTPWPPAENSFTRTLTDLGFGTRYSVVLATDGVLATNQFTVVQGPVHYEAAPRYKSEGLGLTVRDLTYDVRRYLQRQADEPGVVVAKVEAGGKASVAGVKPFELITHVNDQPVKSIKDFEAATRGASELRFSIKRMAKGRIVTIRLAKP